MLSKFDLEPTKAKTVAVGEIFGRLIVLAVGQKPKSNRYMAICQCSCGGGLKSIRSDHLKMGVTLSCGCLQKEKTTTHGLTNSVHYDRWRHMMDRCYNPKCHSYSYYGGRGIRVCESWHDIKTFVDGLPPNYSNGLEIDRINNDGNYEPENVRWVTRQKNATNRRTRRPLFYLGRTQSVSEWADEFKKSRSLVRERIFEFGWDVHRALTEPSIGPNERMAIARQARWGNHTKRIKLPPRQPKTIDLNGEKLTLAELSLRSGISTKLLRKRIFERGWTPERATTQPNGQN